MQLNYIHPLRWLMRLLLVLLALHYMMQRQRIRNTKMIWSSTARHEWKRLDNTKLAAYKQVKNGSLLNIEHEKPIGDFAIFFPSTCSTNSKWMTSKGKEISVMPELALQNGLDDWRIQVWLHCTTCVFSPTPQPTIYDHLTYNTGTKSVLLTLFQMGNSNLRLDRYSDRHFLCWC